MKQFAVVIVAAIVLGGFGWFVWFQPAGHEEETEAPVSEVPVNVARVTRTTLHGFITAYGTVEAEPPGEHPAGNARVTAPVQGVVVGVYCFEGQHVEKGALLFDLDSRTADVAVEFAEKTFNRQKRLLEVEGTSQKAAQDAEAQLATVRAQREWLSIRSPLSGTVVRVTGKPGEPADLTIPLAEIIDLDRLVVSLRVPGMELPGLKTGQTANVITDKLLPPVVGTIVFIGSEIDPRTGTALVRAALPIGSGLRPGQFVSVRVISAEHGDCLAVPIASVVNNEEGAPVIAIVQGDHAVQRPVTTGLREEGWIEVESEGLEPDMIVVTEGAYGLPKETNVRVMK